MLALLNKIGKMPQQTWGLPSRLGGSRDNR